MNKIFKPFIAIFRGIYYIIDKFFVMPISRFIYRISELSRANSGRIEKLLNRPNILVYVSLFCAIAIFLVIDNRAITLVTEEASVITGHPVDVRYNEEAFVVEGVPETVDITLIGRRSDLYLARQLGEHQVLLDLTDFGVGTHRVRLSYNRSIRSVNYKLYPSVVLVRISEKVSRRMNLTYDLLNIDELDSRLNISSVTLDRNEVLVQGSEEALRNVAAVRALIDMEAADLTERGTFTVNSIVLAAYDNAGNRLTNVEMVPARVSASIVVDSYRTELPVRIVTQGSLTTGHAIASASTSVARVSVYGDPAILDQLSYIETEAINLDGLSADREFSVSLRRPAGVRFMSETTTTVTITVGPAATETFNNILIESVNLGNNYIVNAATANDQMVTVIASGVASVINGLEASSITAEIDLSGLSTGTHDVPVIVKIDDVRINLTSTVETVRVRISTRG